MAVTVEQMSQRESRLRSRIDFISDERDAALEDLWSARDRIDELETKNDSLQHDKADLRRSREMWKQRAEAAEFMLSEIHRARRRRAG